MFLVTNKHYTHILTNVTNFIMGLITFFTFSELSTNNTDFTFLPIDFSEENGIFTSFFLKYLKCSHLQTNFENIVVNGEIAYDEQYII